MELSQEAIRKIIYPTAAFVDPGAPGDAEDDNSGGGTSRRDLDDNDGTDESWAKSQLNPKNRIDSVNPLPDPLWRIDGCTGMGTQFYAVPVFLDSIPAIRTDVFVTGLDKLPTWAREVLEVAAAFHTKDASRVRRLGIARLIVRRLQLWTLALPRSEFEASLKNLPFGSRIVLENLAAPDIRSVRVVVVPAYHVEDPLRVASSLRSLWVMDNVADHPGGEGNDLEDIHRAHSAETQGLALPDTVDVSEARVLEELHDSVSLVSIRGRRWILKSITSSTRYLYHELRNLLILSRNPHPNVLDRPSYLVTKQARFGGKFSVVGFTVPYHQGGSLRDVVPLMRIHGLLTTEKQLNWARQLTSALLHIQQNLGKGPAAGFYPDLRLDNVVVSESGDAVVVDLEQRGVWCEFGAPEINFVDYVRILAEDETGQPIEAAETHAGEIGAEPRQRRDSAASSGSVATEGSSRTVSAVGGYYGTILDELLPSWRSLVDKQQYHAPQRGYNIPWLSLGEPGEHEAAMVYMLGRAIWCIFEGVCAPQRATVWQSYAHEPDIEFPDFRHSPARIREMIARCTRGYRNPLAYRVVRDGGKIVLKGHGSGSEDGDDGFEDLPGDLPFCGFGEFLRSDADKELVKRIEASVKAEIEKLARRSANSSRPYGLRDRTGNLSGAERLQDYATAWWRREVAAADVFIRMRREKLESGTWSGDFFGRISLRELQVELERFAIDDAFKVSAGP